MKTKDQNFSQSSLLENKTVSQEFKDNIENTRKLIKDLLKAIVQANDQIFKAKKDNIESISNKMQEEVKKKSEMAKTLSSTSILDKKITSTVELSDAKISTIRTDILANSTATITSAESQSSKKISTENSTISSTSEEKKSGGIVSAIAEIIPRMGNKESTITQSVAPSIAENSITQIEISDISTVNIKTEPFSSILSTLIIEKTIDDQKTTSQSVDLNNKNQPGIFKQIFGISKDTKTQSNTASIKLNDLLKTMDENGKNIKETIQQISTKAILQSYLFADIPDNPLLPTTTTILPENNDDKKPSAGVKDLFKFLDKMPGTSDENTENVKLDIKNLAKDENNIFITGDFNANSSKSGADKGTKRFKFAGYVAPTI
ncbi:hypothetical protein EDEG_01743 [Edhazardia aedis USNM 41457]|uniref:Uncharacterized protein n=1 Tax=Edhazardia aedis (strain USNM 41457) TaxID=1003232 RepID=J9D865_EDHAE|nr:hypothetical protein EDEG_01743 [Edhazardia aedis USNM 41457]|eukprot:EJW03976.1 hypothetical protein EDEG_01743 [Edhazardia aedis USNM 41457]